MMDFDATAPPAPIPPVDSCWNRIGVQGDHSCPRLAEAVHCRNCPVYSAAGRQLFEREAPADYLEEWTQQLVQSQRDAIDQTRSLLVFRVGGEWLALDVHSVIEVGELRPLRRVPHRSDRLLLGIVNIRGELQLCISLQELLHIDAAEADVSAKTAASATSSRRLLVAEQGQNRWVFPVDEVDGVHLVPLAALENLPHTVEKSPRYFTEAVCSLGVRRIGVLSQQQVFQALERTVQ
ncbi:MAG: chemotaxis protein CheW [Thermoguttaceae bacterium]